MSKLTVRRRGGDGPWQVDFSLKIEGRSRRVRRALPVPPEASEEEARQAAQKLFEDVQAEARVINAAWTLRSAGYDLPRVDTSGAVAFSGMADRYIDHARSEGRKASSVGNYDTRIKVHLYPFFGDRDMKAITAEDVDDFKAVMVANKKKASTVNGCLTTLSAIFRLAQRWELVASNPVAEVSMVKRPKKKVAWHDGAAMRGVLDALPIMSAPDWVERLVCALYRTGLRVGEAQALRPIDLDLKGGLLHVRRTWDSKNNLFTSPKSGEERTIPLHPQAASVLKEALGSAGAVSDPIFRARTGGPFSISTLRTWLTKLCEKAKVDRISPHGCRHSFAGQLASQGVSMRILAELLGQSTLSVTEQYAHLSPKTLEQVVSMLPEWNESGTREEAG